MIAWGIVWFLIALVVGLLMAMELINGSIEKRFWICVLLILVLIIIPCFTIQEYIQSIDFYKDYIAFYEKINSQELTESQEYTLLGQAINYNYWLHLHQSRFHKWGVFAPTYMKIKELPTIQLKYFDMDKYRFWEW